MPWARAGVVLLLVLGGCRTGVIDDLPDAGSPPVMDAGPAGCGLGCNPGYACVQDRCLPEDCPARECAVGEVCLDGACTTLDCVALDCPAESACVAGNCYPKSCADVACRPGRVCVEGECTDTQCVGVSCSADSLCVQGTCVSTSCGGPAGCPEGSVCAADGTCQVSDCFGVACPNNSQCVAGACVPCANGGTTVNGTCTEGAPLGGACGSDAQCETGQCVDGVCCATACDGVCERCVGGAPGVCTPVPEGSAERGCGAYHCGAGGSCLTQCASPADCATGRTCQDGTCVGTSPPGAACLTDGVCASGFCVDGRCCTTSCTGACERCDVPGTEGTCTPSPQGSAGLPACGTFVCNGSEGGCPATCFSTSDCAPTAFCINGTCVPRQPAGAGCASANACATGLCVDGVCCNQACTGACQACSLPGSEGICLPLLAGTDPANECGFNFCSGGTACATSCATDAQCKLGNFCSGGACVSSLPAGNSCTADTQCGTGFCADGVCCDSPCNGACQACAVATGAEQNGACTNHARGEDPESECGATYCDGASSCLAGCGADADCKAGHFCNGGTCTPKQPAGTACSAANACASNFCTDGVCCGSPCDGPCQACDLPAAPGACLPLAAGTDPAAECGTTFCSGATACLASCSSDGQCKAGHFCNGGTCTPRRSTGTACAGPNQCASGSCADGICCDSACDGTCQVCAAAAGSPSDGTCANVALRTDSAGECGLTFCSGSASCLAACGSDTDCKPRNYCNGGTCTQKRPAAAACSAANECASGFCADGACCNQGCGGTCQACNLAASPGTCIPVEANTDPGSECGPTFCGGGTACIATCTSDAQCKSGTFCKNGQCAANLAPGARCTSNFQCDTGFCADGVCCNRACDGTCEACTVGAGAPVDGTCATVQAGTDPATECGTTWCSGTAAACLAACAADTDCKTGTFCSAGTCEPKRAQGTACGGDNQCTSTFCVDGVCCNAACNTTCQACSVASGSSANGTCVTFAGNTDPGSECGLTFCSGASNCISACTSNSQCKVGNYCNGGTCSQKLAVASPCTAANRCGTGFCADGVCCDKACVGTCQACAAASGASADGTCTAFASRTDPASECGLALCNGTGACISACGADADCKGGSYCNGGVCTVKRSQGATCAAANQCGTGFCSDGVCCDAACTGSCQACALATGAAVNGSCSNIQSGTDPGNDCNLTWCGGSTACLASCASDTNCKSTAWCSGTTCTAKKALDVACTGSNQCQSGNCAAAFSFTTLATVSTGRPAPRPIVSFDADGDGFLDLAVGHDSPAFAMLQGGVGGSFTKRCSNGVAGGGQVSVSVGETSGDGKPDVVFGDIKNGLRTFTSASTMSCGGSASNSAMTSNLVESETGLLTGDALLDIALCDGLAAKAYVMAGNGSSSFGTLKSTLSLSGACAAISLADVNTDGLSDVVALSTASVDIFYQQASGTFSAPTSLAFISGALDVAVGDIDGNGLPDLVTVGAAGTLSWRFQSSLGVFQATNRTTVSTGGSLDSLALADLDGDGWLDAAAVDATAAQVIAVSGGGTGFNGALAARTAVAGAAEVALGDFDKDGAVDIAVTSNTAGTVVVLKNGSNRTCQ